MGTQFQFVDTREVMVFGNLPEFSLTEPRYDQNTLVGRVKHFYSITDVRSLFISKVTLQNSQSLLGQYKNGSLPPGVTSEQLWNARRVVESVVHPVTGEPIPSIFRFGAYAPMNVFIVSMMLLPSTINSVPRTIFMHWFNQSYNCAVNFANRAGDASEESAQSTTTLLQGYAAAVSVSLSIALGATWISRKSMHMGPRISTLIRATLPFPAVVVAGCANIGLMRRNELIDGVPVFERDGTIRGESVVAGKTGLLKCCSARFLWNVPGMIFPGVVLGWLNSKPAWLRANRVTRVATEIAIVTLGLWAGVPPALAIFPQIDKIPVSKLEEQFHNLVDKDGNP